MRRELWIKAQESLRALLYFCKRAHLAVDVGVAEQKLLPSLPSRMVCSTLLIQRTQPRIPTYLCCSRRSSPHLASGRAGVSESTLRSLILRRRLKTVLAWLIKRLRQDTNANTLHPPHPLFRSVARRLTNHAKPLEAQELLKKRRLELQI